MKDCIFAYTPAGSYLPYVNISMDEKGSMIITVRGETNGHGQQQLASIELPRYVQKRLCGAFIRLDQARMPV